jgi:predicted glycosyltransferase involved in capsule biosynthesis
MISYKLLIGNKNNYISQKKIKKRIFYKMFKGINYNKYKMISIVCRMCKNFLIHR